MSDPVGARKQPYVVKLERGDYYWCACGRSARQPFCDGSHRGTLFSPVKIAQTDIGQAVLCGCKQSRNKPFCDGSHTKR